MTFSAEGPSFSAKSNVPTHVYTPGNSANESKFNQTAQAVTAEYVFENLDIDFVE